MESNAMMKQTMNKMMHLDAYKPLQLTMKDFPMYKLGYDIILFFRKAAYLLFMNGGAHMMGKEETDELYFSLSGNTRVSLMNLYSLCTNFFLIGITMTFACLSAIALIFLPMWIMIPICFWFSPLLIWMSWPPNLVAGTMKDGKFKDEKWFFINGVAVNSWWGSQIQHKLEVMFNRPINMICNSTFGVAADVASIAYLRNFNTSTNTFKLAYSSLKNALEDDKNRKVVLLLHSEGAIIGQMVIDRFLMEMDSNLLSKLEIYTFGSAADKFCDGNRRIPVVEHFANWYDYIAQTGVLHYKMMQPEKYAGSLYLSENFGHWFNQHYSKGLNDKSFRNKEGKTPRLYGYLGGGSPSEQSQ